MTRPLTERQADVLRFIREYHYNYGFAPTVREIGEHLGIRSTNCINGHLQALERRGEVLRWPGRFGMAVTRDQVRRLRERIGR